MLAHAGRLEIYYNNSWGSICNNGFTYKEATVACRNMNMGNGSVLFVNNHIVYDDEGPIWVYKTICNGNEKKLSDCNIQINPNKCKHTKDV